MLQLLPALFGPRDIAVRAIQKHHQRGTAGETIALTVVGVGPVEGTVCLDLRTGGDSDGIKTIELALHGDGRHAGFPNTLGARCLGGLRGHCDLHSSHDLHAGHDDVYSRDQPGY